MHEDRIGQTRHQRDRIDRLCIQRDRIQVYRSRVWSVLPWSNIDRQHLSSSLSLLLEQRELRP